jgi:HPt (histidine-containing phosphotransfer) domain-containing protein
MKGERERCLARGFDEHVTKPVDFDQLVATVGRLGGPLRSQLARHPELRPVVETFVERLPERVAELHRLAEAADLAGLARLAHQLRGTGGNVGYPEVTRVAASLEVEAQRPEPDRAAIARLVGGLEMIGKRIARGFGAEARSS